MPMKRQNARKQYHLLVMRSDGGFGWQIRYNRHAVPVQRSTTIFGTPEEATSSGETALAALATDDAGGPLQA